MKKIKTMTPHVKKSWKGQLIKYEGRIKPEQLWAQIDDEGYFFVELWKPLGTERPLTFNLPVDMYNEAAKKHNERLLRRANPILDKCERKYLSAVIKPFKDRVCYIRKERGDNIHVQYISIKSKRYDYDEDYVDEDDVYEYVTLPYFEKDTMYANMEANKNYTLEELEL